MANNNQLKILMQGSEIWNEWRNKNPNIKINLGKMSLTRTFITSRTHSGKIIHQTYLSLANLSKANLSEAKLAGHELMRANLNEADLRNAFLSDVNFEEAHLLRADLRDAQLGNANLRKADLDSANLSRASLNGANLNCADLRNVNLNGASLINADLSGAILCDADLTDANLASADLSGADISRANLTNTNLAETILIRTKVDKAIISGSYVHGVNVWDLKGEFEDQKDLIITPITNFIYKKFLQNGSTITVDNIKIAQFIYLILNNEEIRDVINTLTSKSILILGRFAIPERKAILDALRKKFREYGLLPIVFDFDRPTDKDFTETIKTLAGLCYFVIADVTNPKSSPLELQATVPDYQIPFVPIIQEGEKPFAMMVDLQKKYNWVLNTVSYDSMETLIKVLKPLIIDPAMKKRQELRLIKAQEPEIISAKDFLAKGKE